MRISRLKTPQLSKYSRQRLAVLLSLLLLFQAGLPLQAHTRMHSDGSGRVVFICTLDGEHASGASPADRSPGASIDLHSPACAFSQLLASANVADLPSCGEPPFIAVSDSCPQRPQQHTCWRDSFCRIRAPPAV